MRSSVYFAKEEIKNQYYSLEVGSSEDKNLYTLLNIAFDSIMEDAFCGVQIPKNQIPKKYLKEYGIDNLWKINLSHSWRLVYSVASAGDGTITIIVEWFDHKEYERRFKY